MVQQKSDKPFLTAADKRIYDENPLPQWVWRANRGACIDCTARDGRKYFYPDALKLKRPHPNCKCTLEVIGIKKRPQNEPFEVERPYPGTVLRDIYKPEETDGWKMPITDFFLDGVTTPFSAYRIHKGVKTLLKQKAEQYSYCNEWALEFGRRADSYSIVEALKDMYYHGNRQPEKVVSAIEKEVTSNPCFWNE